MSYTNYRSWTIPKLKEALTGYGLDIKGNKPDLYERLRKYLGGDLPSPEELLERPGGQTPGIPLRIDSPRVRFHSVLERPKSPPKDIHARAILRNPARQPLPGNPVLVPIPTVAERIQALNPPTEITKPQQIVPPVRSPAAQPSQLRQCLTREHIDTMSYREIQIELKKIGLNARGDTETLRRRLAEGCQVEMARGAVAAVPLHKDTGQVDTFVATRTRPRTFTLEECNNLKVTEIKSELQKVGESTTGRKRELCERLAAYYQSTLPETRKIHNIFFTEPWSYKEDIQNGQHLAVSGRMYNLLKQEPTYYTNLDHYRGRKCEGNAYVFGPLYDLTEYRKIGEHDSHGSMTGFIDYDVWKQSRRDLSKLDDVWTQDIYSDQLYHPFSSLVPEVLFMGHIIGGDIGVTLYGHRDIHGDFDSLIIENNCLFPDDQ